MFPRKLTEEILDHLPPEDPDAIRSRRDLLMLNRMFGNFRWMQSQLLEFGADRIVELGAGDAHFARGFAEAQPDAEYTAIDLAPRPEKLPNSVVWLQGDLFDQLPKLSGDALVANLFLHHLDEDQLRQLGQQLLGFRYVICSEPARFRMFRVGGYVLSVIGLNHVTRHDMHASINAGFREDDLPNSLGLDPDRWRVEIHYTPMGMYRMIAENREPN